MSTEHSSEHNPIQGAHNALRKWSASKALPQTLDNSIYEELAGEVPGKE